MKVIERVKDPTRLMRPPRLGTLTAIAPTRRRTCNNCKELSMIYWNISSDTKTIIIQLISNLDTFSLLIHSHIIYYYSQCNFLIILTYSYYIKHAQTDYGFEFEKKHIEDLHNEYYLTIYYWVEP